MSLNAKAGQSLAKQVPAATEDEVSIPLDGPATVESLMLRIYVGAENTLRLRPMKKKNNGYEDLLDYADDGKHYVDGDDDVWEWDLSVPVGEDEEIVIRYDNRDGSNAHNFRANLDVDYFGGTKRVLEAVKGVLA